MELKDLLHTAERFKEKILLVVGDGLDHVYDLHEVRPTRVSDLHHHRHGRQKALDSRYWLLCEHVRLMTRNALPDPSYEFIYHLARLNLVQAVVSTNYDLTLDTMFSQFSREIPLPVLINPVLKRGQYSNQGYCTPRRGGDILPLWKVHGSLSHVFMRKCHTLFRCPDFAMSFDPTVVLDIGCHPISHYYLPKIGSCCPISLPPKEVRDCLCGHYVHVIDWNIPDFKDQDVFKRILAGGLAEFRKPPFAVIILGFKGSWPPDASGWSEEINAEAEKLDGKGVHWAIFVSEDQYKKIDDEINDGKTGPHSHLWRLVQRNSGICEHGDPKILQSLLLGGLMEAGLLTPLDLTRHHSLFEHKYIPQEYFKK